MTLEQIRSSLIAAQAGIDEVVNVNDQGIGEDARKRISQLLTCRCVIGTALKLLDGQDAGVQTLGRARKSHGG